jgi:hypothetical protein
MRVSKLRNKNKNKKTYQKKHRPETRPFIVVMCSGSGGERVLTYRGGTGHVWTCHGGGSSGDGSVVVMDVVVVVV